MKKMLSLVAVLLCGLVGSCTGRVEQKKDDQGKVQVLSTTAMIGDLVTGVGQERINNRVLITGEIDPHSYELVKGDDEKLLGAQVIFFNGLGLEHGASLHYQLEHHGNGVGLGDRLKSAMPEAILVTDEGEIDPHVWMDVSLWAKTIDTIVDELSILDPEGSAFYRKNGEALRERMAAVDMQMRTELEAIDEGRRYLITSHDAFHYFTRRYLAGEGDWHDRVIAPEGLAPEGQLSISDLRRVIDHMRKYGVKVVFPESNVNKDPLRKIAKVCGKEGIEVQVCEKTLYGDSMGGGNYLEMMLHNVRVMKEAWGK